MTSKKVFETIEFDKILNVVSAFAISNLGKSSIINLLPTDNYDDAICLQEQTSSAYQILYEKLIDPIDYFDDITQFIEKAQIGATLSCAELLRVGRLINSSNIAISKIINLGEEFELILAIVSNMTAIKTLKENIEISIIDENEVSDRASEKLASIRRRISACKSNIREKLNHYITSSSFSKFLQDSIITIRNDRYVIPVKTEYKNEINGLLHDQSSSGMTAYIEPMQIVEINNQLKSLVLDEQFEIERILANLTAQVKSYSSELIRNQNSLITLDVIFAKARYAEHIKAVSPTITKDFKFNIHKGRHPLIAPNKVVPIDIELDIKKNILIISGPNTGGKTVTLKTVGLFSIMSTCGLMLPAAKETIIPIFSNVFCDIGDYQSIENSLSTFSSHIQSLINITDNITDRSLVLIDEIGAGTDPSEGAALAIGIIKFLMNKNVLAIMTTHYSELKEFSLTNPNIRNASMEFDFETLLPTYKIMMDLPGTSNALAIARNLGLNSIILDDAAKAINEEKHNFENVLRFANSLKSQAEKEFNSALQERENLRLEMQKIFQEQEKITAIKEKITAQADREIKAIVAQKTSLANEYIEQIEQILNEPEISDSDLLKAKQNRTAIEKMQYDNQIISKTEIKKMKIEDIRIGEKAYLISLEKECEILSLPDRKNIVNVSVGNMKLNIKADELGYNIYSQNEKAVRSKEETAHININENNFDSVNIFTPVREINILGNTVDEAEAKLDVFIEQALRAGLNEIKIVHGKGTGALRNGVHNYLRSNKITNNFRLGANNEGGNGVTIVILK